MAALCRSYTSHAEALDAVNAVLAAGIPGEGARRTPRVGEFAGGTHPQAHEQGHFAGGEQRGGSFADADREQVVSYPGGVEHARVAGHHKIKKLLTDAGLAEATAERDVKALHAGRVLVEVPEGEAERVGTLRGG
jgi:hypothetical protein